MTNVLHMKSSSIFLLTRHKKDFLMFTSKFLDHSEILKSMEIRDISRQRTSLALQYNTKVEEWLSKAKKDHKCREFFTSVNLVFRGKVSNVSQTSLDNIERKMIEIFDKKRIVATIDLTEDDDEESEPDTSPVTPPLMREPPQPIDDFAQLLTPPPESVPTVIPIPPPKPNLKRRNSCFNAAPNVAAKRRLSVGAKDAAASLHNELESIATYKIKHKPPLRPSIYAKPKEQENVARTIITVPYKASACEPKAPFDPREEAVKLACIKEKIYAKEYLKFDAKVWMVGESQKKQKEARKKLEEAQKNLEEAEKKQKELQEQQEEARKKLETAQKQQEEARRQLEESQPEVAAVDEIPSIVGSFKAKMTKKLHKESIDGRTAAMMGTKPCLSTEQAQQKLKKLDEDLNAVQSKPADNKKVASKESQNKLKGNLKVQPNKRGRPGKKEIKPTAILKTVPKKRGRPPKKKPEEKSDGILSEPDPVDYQPPYHVFDRTQPPADAFKDVETQMDRMMRESSTETSTSTIHTEKLEAEVPELPDDDDDLLVEVPSPIVQKSKRRVKVKAKLRKSRRNAIDQRPAPPVKIKQEPDDSET